MSLIKTIGKKSSGIFFFYKKYTDPITAYNLWSSTYDLQTDNLIIHLNEIIFTQLLEKINVESSIIIHIGCGTGSHWEKILSKNPSQLIGYEVSEQMLAKLFKKYPTAKAYISRNNLLKELKDNFCDLIITTLVIGYIKKLPSVFNEWNRVLKQKGNIIITDLHPAAIKNGATRSFKNKEQTILIKNYLHSIDEIRKLANKAGWKEVAFIERKVDERVKFFYEKLNRLDAYESAYNNLLLYGIHFIKS